MTFEQIHKQAKREDLPGTEIFISKDGKVFFGKDIKLSWHNVYGINVFVNKTEKKIKLSPTNEKTSYKFGRTTRKGRTIRMIQIMKVIRMFNIKSGNYKGIFENKDIIFQYET